MTKFSAPQQSQLAQIGAFLRENREKQEKSLEDIAIRTYIRPQLLNGIEKGDPDLLPEPIFVQGFIRRYAEALGLKGTELAQQFTVTSIPSTPRPAQQPAPANSTSTRISRTTPNQPPSPQNSATTPILSKASSPLPNDPFLNGSQNNGSQNQPDSSSSPAAVAPVSEVEKTKAKETTGQTAEAPPATREDLPADPPIVTNGRSAAISPETSSVDNLLETGRSGNGNLLDTPTEQHSAPIAAANAGFVSEVEAPATFDEVHSNGTRSYQPSPASNDFDRDHPATPTTEMTPEAAPVLPVGPLATNTGPVGIEPVSPEPSNIGYESSSAPNLKPFIIGGVVAALTAVLLILASLLGNGDRQPETTSSVDTTDQPADSAPNSEAFGEDPVEAEPPVSTAPVYVEATATGSAWMSVIADGSTIFEGTLQPGDTQLWEAQENLNIFAGNAGAVELAPNGEAATVMGSNGQQGEKIFTPE
ncbi:hypothetical protein BH23CYA1_BH23CYA1_22710 [soil metagenome]